MGMSITGSGRISVPSSDIATATSATAATRSAADGGVNTGTSTDDAGFNADLKDPAPRHFPWLSRLSAQLDAAAAQKSPFEAAPMVGETLNRAA
ncbi:MAG TPA: hypothetical protein VGM74_11765 [Burkholderiaceae bacterium]|jgi:hypothetical protein